MPKVRKLMEKGFQLLTFTDRAFTPPFYAVIEVNERCCLKCKQCNLWKDGLSKHTENKKLLTDSEIVQVIQDIRKWNPLTKTLMFCGGEPFLEKSIFDYIKVAKRLKFFTTITTNAFMINEKMAKQIVESGLDELCFSLDAPTAEIHDDIRGVSGSFEKVMKANEMINRYKKELNLDKPFLRVNTVISNLNYKHLKEMPALMKKMEIREYDAQYITVLTPEIKNYVDGIYNRDVCPSQWILPQELLIPKEEKDEFWNVISDLKKEAETNEVHLGLRLYNEVQPCSILWGSLLVDSYGEIFPCTMLRDSAGNVKDKKIKQIWNSQNMKNTRKLFNGKKLNSVCTRCCIYPNVFFR
ncbi:MAG: radical SAM protein [Candidatus Nanoarchaeia archaeon]|nr:radical SAM protein [Candidatus Nanoarchaeia archaeon]